MKTWLSVITVSVILSISSICLAEQPDLTGRINGSVQVNGSQVQFQLLIQNIGDAALHGSVRVKPFLIPTTIKHRPSQKAVVLPNVNFQLDLEANASSTQTYSAQMPNVPTGNYLLAAIINSDAAVAEKTILNNITDLVDAGNITNFVAPPTSGFDMYSELSGEISAYYGGASHRLRAIAQAESQPSLNQRDLFGRFLLASVTTRKVYTLPYNTENAEKQWGSFSMSGETRADGKRIFVDVYSQAPSFNDVPPGDYVYMTLINSHDLIPENDLSNNLDMRPLTLSLAESTKVLPIVLSDNNRSATLSFRKVFRNDGQFTIEKDASATWLNLTSNGSQTLTDNATDAGSVQAVTDGLAPGTYTTQLKLIVHGFESYPVLIPVILSTNGSQAAQITLSSQPLSFSTRNASIPAPQQLTISNTGNAPLIWRASANFIWLSIDSAEGTLQPGASTSIGVSVDPIGLGYYEDTNGKITINSNATGSDHPTEVPVQLQVGQ